MEAYAYAVRCCSVIGFGVGNHLEQGVKTKMRDQKLKILAIDDDEQILDALQILFQFQGWQGVFVQDVPAGLKAFRERKPDLVLIDYHLPQISGIKGVELLRKMDADIPIIVFTIDENQKVADRFMEVGATDFALKPIKAPDIVSRIRLHVRLIDQKKELKNREETVKGIDAATMGLIVTSLERHADEPVTVETIARETGLANQTVYRYIQNLVSNHVVEIHQSYGKVGRPKQRFKLV